MSRSFGATLLVVVALLVGSCAGHPSPSASPSLAGTDSSSPTPAGTAAPTPRPRGPVHVAWARVPGNPFGDTQVAGIATLGGRFVAWGEESVGTAYFASSEGTSWTKIPSPFPVGSAPLISDLGTTTVALGVDETGTVVAWAGTLELRMDRVAAPALDRLADLRIVVIDDLHRLLVCGLGKADATPVLRCAVTADGQAWVAGDPPGATASAVGTGLPEGFALLGVDAGSITTWRTSDGRTWVRTDAVAEPDAVQGMHSIAGIAGGQVAGGSRWAEDGSSVGAAWASTDGSLWRLVLTAATNGSVRVERLGDVTLATASDAYCRTGSSFASVDGITWGRSPAPVPVCGSYAALGESIVALAPDDESGRTAIWQGRLTEGPGVQSGPSPASPAPTAGPSFAPPSAPPAAAGLGLAWSRQEIGREAAVVYDVATWSGGLVAIGAASESSGRDRAVAWVSTDGRTWTSATRPPDRLPDESWAVARAVTASGPGLVAVGWANVGQDANPRVAIWTSSDGLEWSRVPNAPGLALAPGVNTDFPEPGPRDVAAWSGGLVAVGVGGAAGTSAVIWTSPDGWTWTPVPDLPDAALRWAHGVAEGPEGLVVVGGSGANPDFRAEAWVSRNGTSWAAATRPAGIEMESVIGWADRLVAVGGAPASWVSSDGRTWTGAPSQKSTRGVRLSDVAGVGDRLVAIGSTMRDDGRLPGAWVSEDGLLWSQPPQANVFVGAELAAITGLMGRVVVVGTIRDGDRAVPTAWISPP
jgi:hypothetical protein